MNKLQNPLHAKANQLKAGKNIKFKNAIQELIEKSSKLLININHVKWYLFPTTFNWVLENREPQLQPLKFQVHGQENMQWKKTCQLELTNCRKYVTIKC